MFGRASGFGLVGAAYGLGAAKPGNELAPAALRRAGVLDQVRQVGIDLKDYGDVPQPAGSDIGDPKAKYLSQSKAFSTSLQQRLLTVYRENRRSLVLGGDHSISIGSLSAASSFLRESVGAQAKLGLLWIDAHADINTPQTTPSGNLHGMAIAALLGLGLPELAALAGSAPALTPDSIVMIGLRDLDPPERQVLQNLSLKAYSMTDLDLHGAGAICSQALQHLEQTCDAFVLSFDLDVCEPEVAPGVGTPVRGGLTVRESHLIMELASRSEKLLGVELVEFNPAIDAGDATCRFAMWLLQSAVGKTIL